MTTLTSGSRIAAPVSQRVPKAQPAVARMHRAKIERTSEGGSARIGAALGEVLAGDPVVMAGEARAQASRPDAAHGAGIVAAQAIEDAGEFLAAPEAVAREVGLVDAEAVGDGDVVGVVEGDPLSARLLQAAIAGSGEPAVIDAHDADAVSVGRQDARCGVGRAVVDDDDLDSVPVLGEHAVETFPEVG